MHCMCADEHLYALTLPFNIDRIRYAARGNKNGAGSIGRINALLSENQLLFLR